MSMNDVLVLYKSEYGATKKYVDMLKKELDCDVYEMNTYNEKNLEKYDWIIFASGIYASGISGLNVLRKKYRNLSHKKIIIFCVGASPFDEKAFDEIKRHNLKEDLKDIPIFYGRGAWDEEKMNWRDCTLCRMLQKAIAKKDPSLCEPWMKALLVSGGRACDWVDRSYLIPLLEFIKTVGK